MAFSAETTDKLATDLTSKHFSANETREQPSFSLEYFDTPEPLEREWRDFQEHAVCTIYQTYEWVTNWCRHAASDHGERPLFVVGRDGHGRLAFIWPLAVSRSFGLGALGWLGQSYAGYNMGLYATDIVERITGCQLRCCLDEIVRNYREICVANFYHQPSEWLGVANPFSRIPWLPTDENAYILELHSDFENLFESKFRSKTRQTLRRQEKKLRSCGEVEIARGESREVRLGLLCKFLDQKADQLSKIGVYDVYSNPGLSRFLRQVVGNEPKNIAVDFFHLDVDGETVAIIGGAYFRGMFYYLFVSKSLDPSECARWSPGTVLLRQVIGRCCANGVTHFDFGSGPSPAKRAWHPQEIQLFNNYFALRAIGAPQAVLRRAALRGKRVLKYNRHLWPLARRARDAMRGVRARTARRMTGR